MPLWVIPMVYVTASVVCGLVLPRLEQAYGTPYTLNLSVASAQAYLSAAASGMMALTGVVFAMAFVMVQFSAIAYSPRLVLWFARDRTLFHGLGVFTATFVYALFTLGWVDRSGSGSVPMFSGLLVAIMVVLSMILFARLMQRLSDLQISSVLHLIGDKGRDVIRDMFVLPDKGQTTRQDSAPGAGKVVQLGLPTQTLRYAGPPRTIAKFNLDALVEQARRAEGVVVMACGVGDTVVKDTLLLQIYDAKSQLSEAELIAAIHLAKERTFEQDPKYPIRLLVDVALKALSPAINDPTTAVQTIDQLEDLLLRLGERDLGVGCAEDATNTLRLVIPMPTWEDYLTLAFDEIRQFGSSSVQVMRRLRSALEGLKDALPSSARSDAVCRHLKHLDCAIERSPLDPADRIIARQQDRQGLGLSKSAGVIAESSRTPTLRV